MIYIKAQLFPKWKQFNWKGCELILCANVIPDPAGAYRIALDVRQRFRHLCGHEESPEEKKYWLGDEKGAGKQLRVSMSVAEPARH